MHASRGHLFIPSPSNMLLSDDVHLFDSANKVVIYFQGANGTAPTTTPRPAASEAIGPITQIDRDHWYNSDRDKSSSSTLLDSIAW
ncbi:hypothetical protein DL93DRAFT_1780141 [Clavulina sp. PMI_390]|nr:hypothetical protein DL93DRAFT_1317641 [Clavulina sp. PMI_390]KAF8309181.1 hypothetical protein DL93DRAFT_1780141 [Clavulina sp. PMI_390]